MKLNGITSAKLLIYRYNFKICTDRCFAYLFWSLLIQTIVYVCVAAEGKAGFQHAVRVKGSVPAWDQEQFKIMSRYFYPTNSVCPMTSISISIVTSKLPHSVQLTRRRDPDKTWADCPPLIKTRVNSGLVVVSSFGPLSPRSRLESKRSRWIRGVVYRWDGRSGFRLHLWQTYGLDCFTLPRTDAGPPALPFKVRLAPQRGECVTDTKVSDQRERQPWKQKIKH